MALVNHAKREINAKIVLFGPEGTGKSTSLRYVYGRIKPALRGEIKALPSSGSSLLFFEFSPFDQPLFAGYRLRLHLYTLQGKVANPAAWKLTLKGADGLMIVADAAPQARDDLQESVVCLRELLSAYGVGLDELPLVLQLNKADLLDAMPDPNAVAREMGLGTGTGSACLTTASTGDGVLEALSSLSRLVMDRLKELPELRSENVSVSDEPPAEVTVPDARPEAAAAGFAPPLPPEPEDVSCRVQVKQEMVTAVGSQVRIPLEITCAGKVRNLVVTVSVAEA